MKRPPTAVAASGSATLALCALVAACGGAPPAPRLSTATPPLASAGGASPRATASAVPRVAESSASAAPTAAPRLSGERLAAAVSAQTIRPHLAALQRIADAHGGNRAAGTPGFDASADYVATHLEAAGYAVTRDDFSFPFTDPVSGVTEQRASVNLIAELPGDGTQVVMLGAHLDSVPIGPGINDNGSGSMTLLELAARLQGLAAPGRTVRFAFWSAEESGPFGSTSYVESLEPAERDRIVAYLNFDMLGSPNHIRFVYSEEGAAAGSDALTELFAHHFEASSLAWEPIDLGGHADHDPFVDAGIPTGGLFSGGHDPKTDPQAAAFGGTAGLPADPCVHTACDTIANVSDAALDEMADAIAHVLVELAHSD